MKARETHAALNKSVDHFLTRKQLLKTEKRTKIKDNLLEFDKDSASYTKGMNQSRPKFKTIAAERLESLQNKSA